MAEKDTVFSRSVKYTGILSFKDFYKFCHDWLSDEIGLIVIEEKYSEIVKGDSKDLKIKWAPFRKLTDYFKFEMEVEFVIYGLKKVQVNRDGKETGMDQVASFEVKVKGLLVRDYESKFETSGFAKSMRGIYEKWIIPSRVDEFEGKIIGRCDEFLGQTKAYLDLEGRK